MQRWEYMTISIRVLGWKDSLGRSGELPELRSNVGDPAGLLNELGEQGWELAGVDGGGTASFPTLYLKRPRS